MSGQTLQNIKQLQDLEKDLYLKLEQAAAVGQASVAGQASTTQSAAAQTEIIKKINELSQMRINLFKSLNQMSSAMQHNVASTRIDLVDQIKLIGIVEQELNNAKAQMNQSATIRNNKMRMVEINTYYGKRYKAYTQLLKLFILICLLLLISTILKKKSFVPETITNGISLLIIIVGGFFFLRKLFDITMRDNMNFDERSWIILPTGAGGGKSVYEYDKEQIEGVGSGAGDEIENEAQTLGSSLGGCIGADCCSSSMIYDAKAMQCVDNPTPLPPPNAPVSMANAATSMTVKESFLSSILDMDFLSKTKKSVVKSFDFNMKNNYASV